VDGWGDWASVILGMLGGLAIFLIGMDVMTDALKALAGHRLQRILSRLSGNRFTGAATGMLSTAALQSSSITTVLTVGLVGANMLTVTQSAAVIIGANLGTTITAQIIALNISELALGLIAVGALLWLFVSQRTWKATGQALAALGLVFLGLKVMGDALLPLASYQPVIDVLSGATNPIIAVAAGAAVTALIQSSSATTGIVIAISAAGLIDLPTGIAIILGANIGTCVTALLAAIGKGRPALRTAMIHVLVNLLGALLWLILLRFLVGMVEFVNPADVTSPRQLANAHTIFNLANTVIFLALLTPLVALATRIVPDREVPEPAPAAGSRLDPSVVQTAALGLSAAAAETRDMGVTAGRMFDEGFSGALEPREAPGESDANLDELKSSIRNHHRQIVGYLAELSHSAMDDDQSRDLISIVSTADEIAHLADSLASGFRRINRRRLRSGARLDSTTRTELQRVQQRVSRDYLRCVGGVVDETGSHEGDDHQMATAEQDVRDVVPSPGLDTDSYILESDLREILARVAIAVDRIDSARSDRRIAQAD
jgi:phosphate:Na+ symporter